MTRYESLARQKERREYYLKGQGVYLYRNNVPGTLDLPKPTEKGQTKVEKNEEWEGDDYYMSLVKSGMARLVKEIKSPETERTEMLNETLLNEDKLIVDQPDRVTVKGVVEQVVVQPNQPVDTKKKKKEEKLQEQKPQSQEDQLLIEDPLAGVTILG